jgi:hypothetical protein
MNTPATPNGKQTPDTNGRDRRGRFAQGNPGRPSRHRNGPPSPNGHFPERTAEPTLPQTTPASGRDRRGRFAGGNAGGPGNPFARRVAALRTALLDLVSEEDIRSIARRLILQAHTGDLGAVKLLFLYALGKPAEVVDPDSLDVKEWQMYQHTLVRPEEVNGLLQRLPPEIVVVLARIVLPCLGQTFRQQFLQQLGACPEEVEEVGSAGEADRPGV